MPITVSFTLKLINLYAKKVSEAGCGDIAFWAAVNNSHGILEYSANITYQIHNHCQKGFQGVFPHPSNKVDQKRPNS